MEVRVYNSLIGVLLFSLLGIVSCKKENLNSKNGIIVNTLSPIRIGTTTTIFSADVYGSGSDTALIKGICYSSSNHSPTISDTKTINGTGNGGYKIGITGLLKNTKYYVRAYATNNKGTVYGNTIEFNTFDTLTSTKPNYIRFKLNGIEYLVDSDGMRDFGGPSNGINFYIKQGTNLVGGSFFFRSTLDSATIFNLNHQTFNMIEDSISRFDFSFNLDAKKYTTDVYEFTTQDGTFTFTDIVNDDFTNTISGIDYKAYRISGTFHCKVVTDLGVVYDISEGAFSARSIHF